MFLKYDHYLSSVSTCMAFPFTGQVRAFFPQHCSYTALVTNFNITTPCLKPAKIYGCP